MKVRVGMGMGMVKRSGYGYTHFWVRAKYPGMGMGMGMAHKFLGALKIARFSCSTMTSTIIRIVFTYIGVFQCLLSIRTKFCSKIYAPLMKKKKILHEKHPSNRRDWH